MSSLHPDIHDDDETAANPLDLVEKLAIANDWPFHRQTDEELMHAVTAVSGSGPAYVFHLIEALAAAGVQAGLPEPLAMDLARGTVVGAGELARQSTESAAQLRVNVTSPGGTTAAALQVLTAADGFGAVLARAVAAAAQRSRELA